MTGPNRTQLSDLRGAARMVFDAGAGIAGIVERMHRTIELHPGPFGAAATDSTRGITGLVYRSVRDGMRLVGQGLDASLAPVAAMLPDGVSSPARDAFLSAVNGVYGDYLARTGNPLAIELSLRRDGRRVDPADPASAFGRPSDPRPSGRLLVLVHGLCMNDRQWNRDGHDHGTALAAEFGCTALYVRYNSGLHVADNGRALADMLEALVASWPRTVEDLTIIGHSMGGLVARAACHSGQESGHAWPRHLRRLFFLGTPHHGAPLERGGQRLDFVLELSPYSAPFTSIGRARSAGITDLRLGTITRGAHRHVPLPAGVRCHALAATLDARGDGFAGHLVGDGLVTVDSALGRHADPARTLAFPKSRQWIGFRMGHLELLNRPEVYARLHAGMREKG